MKLELVASPGHAPAAMLVRGVQSHRNADYLTTLPVRLLGPSTIFAPELSYRWNCRVWCSPEFKAFWTRRDDGPPADHRIFLWIIRA